MIKKYLLLWALTLLTACSTLPNIEALPEVKTDSRTFKVEQLAEQQVKQTSLLTVQFQPEQWRWVQTDPLGSPIARLLLTKQGWKNDGFVMPNKQAQGLFLALATAFTEQQPDAKHLILMNVDVSHQQNTAIYQQNGRFLWNVRKQSNQYIQTLLEGSDSPLTFSNKHFQENGLQGKYNTLGEVNTPLRAFPADLPQKHHSRNNQLLWHSLEQIEPTIQQAISRFGRHRIAVVIGTSTTGVDENLPVFKYAAEHEDWSGAEFNQQQQYFSAPADFIAHQYDFIAINVSWF